VERGEGRSCRFRARKRPGSSKLGWKRDEFGSHVALSGLRSRPDARAGSGVVVDDGKCQERGARWIAPASRTKVESLREMTRYSLRTASAAGREPRYSAIGEKGSAASASRRAGRGAGNAGPVRVYEGWSPKGSARRTPPTTGCLRRWRLSGHQYAELPGVDRGNRLAITAPRGRSAGRRKVWLHSAKRRDDALRLCPASPSARRSVVDA